MRECEDLMLSTSHRAFLIQFSIKNGLNVKPSLNMDA